VAVFLLSALLGADDPAHEKRRLALFQKLDTPIDVAREVGDTPDPTAQVFRFLSRATALVGLASLLVLLTAPPGERAIVVEYAGLTLFLAAGLALVRGSRTRAGAAEAGG
jgi:hypothetical protein